MVQESVINEVKCDIGLSREVMLVQLDYFFIRLSRERKKRSIHNLSDVSKMLYIMSSVWRKRALVLELKMVREGLQPIGISGRRGRRLLVKLLKCHGLLFSLIATGIIK